MTNIFNYLVGCCFPYWYTKSQYEQTKESHESERLRLTRVGSEADIQELERQHKLIMEYYNNNRQMKSFKRNSGSSNLSNT